MVPLIVSAFIARKPGTHVHVATSGLMLLAGAGYAALWNLLPGVQRGVMPRQMVTFGLPRLAAVVLFTVGISLVGLHIIPVYLRTTAEVVRENRVGSLPLAWRPPGGYPTDERFGFPYQGGWKAIGALYANGTLAGSYDSNEQPQVSYWYTRGEWRCSTRPRYYFIAEGVQEESDIPERIINTEYHPIARLMVAGEVKMRIFERGKAPAGSRPATWIAEDFAPTFERQVSAPRLDPGVWARGVMARDGVSVSVNFGEEIGLLGYQVLAEDPRPGGVVRVDLFWMPHVTARETHRIDVQLGLNPRIGDGGGPACNTTGDDRDWRAERPFTQRVSIPIAAGTEAGSYPLLVSVNRTGAGGGPLAPTGGPSTGDPLVEIGRIEIRDGDASRPAR
jgi:hypothetical protein